MKKTRMNISHSRFILFKLKIFGEIVTTKLISYSVYISNYSFQNILLKVCKASSVKMQSALIWKVG